MSSLNYAKAGVKRSAADQFVEKITQLAVPHSKRVKASIGGYASLFELSPSSWIAASTDGVGTKLKLAFETGIHKTVGIDLVAMSVNDLLCVGSLPLFFLDYFATSQLDQKMALEVIHGILQGCSQAGCALVGGETAQMPGFYAKGEYDLAGFAVGSVHPRAVLPKRDVASGDFLIGLSSSGCHSNGYSLLRKWIPSGVPGKKRMRELLTPTRIYVSAVKPLLEGRLLKGMAHITGSGFLNLPRLGGQVSYQVRLPDRNVRPKIFDWVESVSNLPLEELSQTFNMGIGMVLVVAPSKVKKVVQILKAQGEYPHLLGNVVARRKKAGSEVFVTDWQGRTAILSG